jgi:hypothetical protein
MLGANVFIGLVIPSDPFTNQRSEGGYTCANLSLVNDKAQFSRLSTYHCKVVFNVRADPMRHTVPVDVP